MEMESVFEKRYTSIKFLFIIGELENVWEEGRADESEEDPLQRVSY